VVKVNPSGLLTLDQRPAIDALLSTLCFGQSEQTLADTTFTNLFLFRAVHDYRFLMGDWPCISGRGYDGLRHLVPLFDLRSAPSDVLRDLLSKHEAFFPVSGLQLEGLDQNLFEWTASRDDADYVYPVSHFLHYRGGLLQKKRNLVKQLRRAHEVTVQLYSLDVRDEALGVLAQWMQAKGKRAGEADDIACKVALQLAPELGLAGYVFRVENAMVGFLLTEELQPEVCVVRFAKANDRLKGIYQHMFQQLCLAKEEVQWLNFEQDMGIANLRQTKLSYQPALLLPKYRVHCR
jgi:hypothetical protein